MCRSAKLWDLGEKRTTTVESTQNKMKYFIDETASAIDFHSSPGQQKQAEQTHKGRKSPQNPPSSPLKRNEFRPKLFRRSPSSRTPIRTFTAPGSKATSPSSCHMWSPDVYNTIVISVPRKAVLNIPSVKRRALMGYDLPVVNEQSYVSCPAISKGQVILVNCG